MRRVASTLALAALIAIPVVADAQGRYGRDIPRGQMPPAGRCRVWYDNRPAGQQPPPTSCNEAERIASRSRNARVIYGDSNRQRRDDDWWGSNRDPRSSYPGRYPSRARVIQREAFDNGYNDGYDKGREDARDNDRYDPVRHSRYRSADRGYNSRFGSKDEYKDVYREGFRAGYDEGYRLGAYRRDDRRRDVGFPWPF